MAELIVLYFDSTHGAEEAVLSVRKPEDVNYAWADDVAIVERHKSGRVATHTSDASTTQGAAVGGMTGLVVGLIFPPAGVLALLGVGAAVGAGVEKIAKENGLDSDMLKAVKDSLGKGTSAILLVGASGDVDEMMAVFSAHDPSNVMRAPMPEESMSGFWAALQDSAD